MVKFLNKIRLFFFLVDACLTSSLLSDHTILAGQFARLSQLLRSTENARNGSWALTYSCLHISVMLHDTGETGNGRKGEEDVVSVAISWLKNIVQVVVQETPSWSWFSEWRALWVVVCSARLLVSAPLTEFIMPLPWRVLKKICVCKRWNILSLQNEDCSSRWNKQLLKVSVFQASDQIHSCSAILTLLSS